MKKTAKQQALEDVGKMLADKNGPLSDLEMKNYAHKLEITRQISGMTGPFMTDQERVLKEVLYYRSRPHLIVTMDEHHSSMGTSAIAICLDRNGVEHHVGTDFPMAEMGFDTSRGQRYLVTVDKMTPNKKMKPRKNPFQKWTSPIRSKRTEAKRAGFKKIYGKEKK